MIERLKKIKERFEELTKDLMNPDVLADMSVWQKKSKEQSELTPIVEKYDEYVKVKNDMSDAEEMLKTEKDADMVAMLESEFYDGKEKLKTIEEELKILLLPKDENDEGNVIVEIRAGVGGDEAGIKIRIEYSTDSGKTWVLTDAVTIESTTLETFRITLPDGVKRVAIVVVENSGRRVNIDEIKLLK